LFWNEFQTEKPRERKTKRSRNRNLPTNYRRRKGISTPKNAIEATPNTRGEIKKSLKLEDRKLVTGKNPLNLPYSDSGSEEEKERARDSLHIKQRCKIGKQGTTIKAARKTQSTESRDFIQQTS
jgi:hypothetical protein